LQSIPIISQCNYIEASKQASKQASNIYGTESSKDDAAAARSSSSSVVVVAAAAAAHLHGEEAPAGSC
jgi:hypothetical protein